MELAGTGAQLWPLNTGNNQAPTLSPGVPTAFFLNTVPDRCPSGPLAYYLPVVLLTIYGSVVQPASGGSVIFWDQLLQCLIDSVDWINAWHGTVVSANHVKGTQLPVIEYYANGFRYGARRRPPIPAAAGTYQFQYTIAITPSISRLGRLMPDTMQLAKLFLQSQLKINVAAANVISNQFSTGATLGTLTAKASAVLVPRQELVLGTPVETILHQVVAGSTSNAVQIKGFGTDTMLKGINNKGGVVFLGELTSVNNQGGAFAMQNVTQFSFPWRGQEQTQHPEGIVCMTQYGNMVNDRSNVFPTVVAGGDAEYNNMPFAMLNSDAMGASTNTSELTNNLFWPMVQGGDDLTLAELQTAAADAQYFLSVAGGFTGSTHMILAMYARQWLDTMMADWVKQVTDGGNDSLASYVLGGTANVAKAKLQQRRPRIKHVVTPDQTTYLPWQFI